MQDFYSDLNKIIKDKKNEIDGIKKVSIFKEGFEPIEFKNFVEDKEFCNFIKLTKRQLDACYAMLYGYTYDDYVKNKNNINKNIFDNPIFNLAVLEWGKGGFRKGTIIEDKITKERHTVEEWESLKKPINVEAIDFHKRKKVITTIKPIFKEGKAKIYRIKTKLGKIIEVDENHKLYTKNGWKKIKELKIGDSIAYAKRNDM